MPVLDLKPLTQDLLPAVLDLDRRCFGGLWTLEGYQRELDSPNSELLVLQPSSEQWITATSDKAEVEASQQSLPNSPSPPLLGLGCYWSILEEAHITILAIDPTCQGQGLGQALLCALLNSACRRGLERATLEVRISNQPAFSLYTKFGFREAGRRRRYYPDTGEDALVLWRGGLQKPEFPEFLGHLWQQVNDRSPQTGWWLKTDETRFPLPLIPNPLK